MKVKGLLWLIVTIVLMTLIPSIKADTEALYCNSFDSTVVGWIEVGDSPYLLDTTTDYITTGSAAKQEAYFGFQSSTGGSSINSVLLYVDTQLESGGDDQIEFYVIALDIDEVSIGVITPNVGSYSFQYIDISTIIDTFARLDSMMIKAKSIKVGKAMNDVWLRRAYLYVDYTASATVYSRDLDLTLTLSNTMNRFCTNIKNLIQSFSITIDSIRSNYVVKKLISQTINLASNVYSSIMRTYIKTLNLGLTISSSITRLASYNKLISQALSWGSSTIRGVSWHKEVSQLITWSGNSIGELIMGTITQIRDVTLNISVSSITQKISTYIKLFSKSLSLSLESITNNGGSISTLLINTALDISLSFSGIDDFLRTILESAKLVESFNTVRETMVTVIIITALMGLTSVGTAISAGKEIDLTKTLISMVIGTAIIFVVMNAVQNLI